MFKESKMSTKNIANRVQERQWLFLLILILMSVAGLFASDIYLPSLPDLSRWFGQSPDAMQYTLGIYLLGMSIGQLIYGPLTERYGRKNLIIIGVTIYFLASLSCAFSYSYYQLLFSRLVQALGACSGLIIGRSIVGDLYDAKESGKIFSTIFPFVGMSPAISPVIGGMIGHYFGWQSTFIFVSLFALVLIFLVKVYLPETQDPATKKPLNIGKIITTYPAILFNKKFILYASASCAAYMAYFSYIAQSPFIFSAYGYGERAIGCFYVTLSLTYVLGNLTCKKLLNKWSIDTTLRRGYIIFCSGALLLFLSGYLHLPLFMMVAAISVLTFGNGFLLPLGAAGVVSSFASTRGYASGLLGFVQLGLAALAAAFIGHLSHNSVTGLGGYVLLVALLGLFINLVFQKVNRPALSNAR